MKTVRRYAWYEAYRDFRVGEVVAVLGRDESNQGRILHDMPKGTFGFVQIAGPPEQE